MRMFYNITAKTGFVLPLLLIIILFGVVGCEGPQGPPGEGVSEFDARPPSISWVTPTRSDTIFTPTFDVRVAASDNHEVTYVEFYLDGISETEDTAAVDSSSPYTYTWDLTRLDRSYGVYPIIARAWDPSRNFADTPPLLVYYSPPPSDQLLSYFGSGELDAMHLPDRYGDKYFNVRFTPIDSCTVEEVHFYFGTPSDWIGYGDNNQSFVGGYDFNLFLWRSNASGLPDVTSGDSLVVAETSIQYDDWTIVDVSGMDSTAYNGDFHAGFSPPSDQYATLFNAHRALPLYIQVDPLSLSDPDEHRSVEFEEGSSARGWGTVQSHWDNEKRDFLIRVKVSYINGTTAMLTPSLQVGELDEVAR